VMGGYDGHRCSLYYLGVHPEFRCRGIANALISRLEKKLIAKGCPQITLMIPEENDATICMFEKLLYEDQNQENTAYTKRLIIDQDFDL
ncbi:GNAT family N-acetyltransferase, partial [Proteus mirabilis]